MKKSPRSFEIINGGNHFSGPVGRCIYCNSEKYSLNSSRNLSDEHCIPLSLGGNLILKQASCGQCEKITSAIDGTVSRKILGPIRIYWGLPTRRRKDRPESLPVLFTYSDGEKLLPVDISEYPPACAFVRMQRPRLIAKPDKNDEGDKQIITIMPISVTENQNILNKLCQKYGALRAEVSQPIGVMSDFGLMLARVAHSLVYMCIQNYDDLHLFLPEIIKNKDHSNLKLYVGRSVLGITSQNDFATVHKFQFRKFFRGRQQFLVLSIQLFAALNFPVYDIVVARLLGNTSNVKPHKDFCESVDV